MVEQELAQVGAAPAAAQLKCPDGSRPRLLLAEDSSTARILTAALLKRMGCEVDAVEHGEEALDHVRARDYDLVLLDIEMPVMDGVSAAKEIRALDGVAGRTPLMALSAFLADSAKCGSWREAFDHALSKPAGRAELQSAIQFLLNTRKSPGGARAPGEAGEALTFIDQAAMAETRTSFDDAQWNDIVSVAIHEMQDCVGTIEIMLERNDRAMVRRQSHKLKGIARSFAAPKLAAAAFAFERDSETSSARHLGIKAAELRKTVNRTTAILAALSAN